MNEVTRGAYVRDCEIGVKRWNRLIAKAGFASELTLPSTRFRRSIGAWAGRSVDPAGQPVAAAEWQRREDEWLPSESDRAFVRSLMHKVVEPGKMASWIAPPDRGINNLPVEYEYVHLR
jgi:benzoyl-CoA 2,3-dioxygenase component B